MGIGEIIGIMVGVLSIISILVGLIVALIKTFSKMAVILSSINQEITQIKLMFEGYDEKIEDIEGELEETAIKTDANATEIKLINQRCAFSHEGVKL